MNRKEIRANGRSQIMREPKRAARRGKSRPHYRVLLTMDYYIHQVHIGVVNFAQKAGWILTNRADKPGQIPPGWQADGILTSVGSDDVFDPQVLASGLPIVNMSPWAARYGKPSVQLDDFKSGELAAEHLISLGFMDLSMMQLYARSLTSDGRRRGFAAATERAGRRFHPLVLKDDRGEHSPRSDQVAWLKHELTSLPRPLGIFTEGDGTAVQLLHICEELGLRVPADIAVVGINNNPLEVGVAPVPLSSVDNNLNELGYRAAELLNRLMNGEPPPEKPIMIPPRSVVQRQSTNVVAVANEDVAAALSFIHQQFREPITVANVAQETNISLRRLQDLFFEHMGRTMLQEITRCRLELAKQMLFESPLKIGQIARKCGMGSGEQMCRVFTRELQLTPNQYRDRIVRVDIRNRVIETEIPKQ